MCVLMVQVGDPSLAEQLLIEYVDYVDHICECVYVCICVCVFA